MTKTNPKRLAVLVSGSGTNLQVIIDSIENGELNAVISVVVSNVSDAFALTRAAKHGIKTVVHKTSDFQSRKAYDTELVAILKQNEAELIVLAGFMRILSDTVISSFTDAIINIHPALLPSFPGLHAQQQALNYGVMFSGCTVHFVDTGTDTGPIIMQAVVPVFPDDTEATLSARILKEEHRIYPKALKLCIEQRVTVSGRKVLFKS